MADNWETTKVEDVQVGDVLRYAGQEFTVARVDAPFLGRDEMVCFIEDTATRWHTTPRCGGPTSRCNAAERPGFAPAACPCHDATRMTDGPLAHLRVLDLSRLQPGAFCTGMLADFGADVLRVEEPGGGDPLRCMPGATNAYNRGKRSMTLDLKQASA